MCGRQNWCQDTVSGASSSKTIVSYLFLVSKDSFRHFFVPPLIRNGLRDQVPETLAEMNVQELVAYVLSLADGEDETAQEKRQPRLSQPIAWGVQDFFLLASRSRRNAVRSPVACGVL